MMKFSSVDFGVSVEFALIADDVTDVAPRFVTAPLTVCERVALGPDDVVAGTSIECV